jgi:hypothetical protein
VACQCDPVCPDSWGECGCFPGTPDCFVWALDKFMDFGWDKNAHAALMLAKLVQPVRWTSLSAALVAETGVRERNETMPP